jgi:hypothetical protein
MSNTFSAHRGLSPLRTQPSLANASRVTIFGTGEQRISVFEVATLFVAGVLAAMAIGFVHLPFRVPGHAILRATLPITFGLALVPRRGAGSVMSVSSALAAVAMSWGSIGRFPPAAILSVVALGPVLDIALRNVRQGWKLYATFAAAGAIANLLAFATRVSMTLLDWESVGGSQLKGFWSLALVSFVLCGAIAGLLSATICFRWREADDLRRD